MAYSINDNCVCCRMCDVFCPESAIKYGGGKYAIDPDKCVECGKCLEYCNTGAIVSPEAAVPATAGKP